MKRTTGLALAAAMMMSGGASIAAAQDLDAFLNADAEAGAAVFRQCSACHMVGANAMNRVGPPLNGIIGRDWGSVEGFNYSDSHTESGVEQGGVWTVSIMATYLENPRAMVPRTRMAFAGLRQPGQIENVIKYLAGFDADGNEVDPAPALEENFGG